MRPLVEKSAASSPAKSSGLETGFRSLGTVLKQKNDPSEFSESLHGDKSSGCEMKLETIEEEGVVKRILVHCSCGELIEIDCQYAG